jgi:hypothetical protein
MPADHSLGFDNEEDLGPAGPEAAESHPEQPVPSVQGRPRSLALEHGDLLAQSGISRAVSLLDLERKKTLESTQHSEEQLDHEVTVVARGALRDAQVCSNH